MNHLGKELKIQMYADATLTNVQAAEVWNLHMQSPDNKLLIRILDKFFK